MKCGKKVNKNKKLDMNITKKIKENKKALLKKNQRVLLAYVDDVNARVNALKEAFREVHDMNVDAVGLWREMSSTISDLFEIAAEQHRVFGASPDYTKVHDDTYELATKLEELGIDPSTVLETPPEEVYTLSDDYAWEWDWFEGWEAKLDANGRDLVS